MQHFLLRVVVSGLAVLLAGSLPQTGVIVRNLELVAALAFAVVLGVLNAFVRPLLLLLTLPINIITLGLFTLIVNALIFWLATLIPVGVEVDGFRGAFIGALFVSVVSFVASRVAR